MSKTSIERGVYQEIKYWSTLKNPNEKILAYLNTVRPLSKRTSSQNNALHKDCEIIATKLNDAGKDIWTVLKKGMHIPWTTTTVKEFMYHTVIKSMFNKTSTRELEKHGEIEKVHDVIMRELGEKHGIEYHEFPHDPAKKKEFEESLEVYVEYPENNLGEQKF